MLFLYPLAIYYFTQQDRSDTDTDTDTFADWYSLIFIVLLH